MCYRRNLVALDTSDSEVQATCGKRAHTLSHELSKPENERSDDPEVELEARPQKPLQKQVSIHLAANVQPAPIDWKSGVQRQFTFHDLNWKPLDTEENESQRKRLVEVDEENRRDVKLKEEREERRRSAGLISASWLLQTRIRGGAIV